MQDAFPVVAGTFLTLAGTFGRFEILTENA
jgi:hypothetical protein